MYPIAFQARDVHAPADDTAAVVTYTGISGRAHMISGVAWSYDAAPTGGSLKIEDGAGNVVFGPHAITAGGPGFFWLGDRQGAFGADLIVTLAAGGSSVAGVVTVLSHRTTPNRPIGVGDDFEFMLDLSKRENSMYEAATL